MTVRGRCMCGAITFTADDPRPVVNCHCERCRRHTGHFMAATGTTVDRLRIHDDATLRWYGTDEHAEYGFCAVCGSSLFWRGSGDPDWVSICAGPLDPPTGLRTDEAWYVARASDYHVLDDSIASRAEE